MDLQDMSHHVLGFLTVSAAIAKLCTPAKISGSRSQSVARRRIGSGRPSD